MQTFLWLLVLNLLVEDSSSRTQRLRHLIVNGRNADPSRYPYFAIVASIDQPESSFCGGVVVHEDLVLTSAHCLKCAAPGETIEETDKDEIIRKLRVFINPSSLDYVVQNIDNGIQIPEVLIHPEYGFFDDELHRTENDLMLLRVDTKVEQQSILSVNSDASLPAPGQSVVVMGYGIEDLIYSQLPDVLQEAQLEVVPQDTCASFYTTIHEAKYDICAHNKEGRNACYGDSGGPLVVAGSPDMLVGLVAHGPEEVPNSNYTVNCGDPVWPVVYVRVSAYMEWIESSICDLSQNPPSSCYSMAPSPVPSVNPSADPSPAPSTTPSDQPSSIPTIESSGPSNADGFRILEVILLLLVLLGAANLA